MDQYLEISEQAKDRISNIEAVYAAKQEQSEIENYAELNERNTVIHRDALRNNWYFRVYEEMLIIGSFALFNYLLFQSKGIDKKTKIALFVAENYYFLKILNQTQSNIVSILTNIGEAQAQIEYLKEIVNPDINLKPKGKKKDSNLALNISKLNFRYDEESPWIFEDLNLQIRHGEKIFLKGNSGSGKSTFLKLLMRSLDQNSGMIKIYGNTNKARIRKEIQIVDQRTNLFNDTVLENIKYGNNATTKQIEIVIDKMNTDIFKNLKDGLITEVGVDGSNVSGGQRQAIVLLRCFFSKSRLLLLDEPISGIDEENVDIILELIKQIGENKTVIAISHNPRLKEITDREITLNTNKTDEIVQHSFSTI
jgi:ABC-type bacteriocin/lantibiotic exporter with double-glycine peptidase domain